MIQGLDSLIILVTLFNAHQHSLMLNHLRRPVLD